MPSDEVVRELQEIGGEGTIVMEKRMDVRTLSGGLKKFWGNKYSHTVGTAKKRRCCCSMGGRAIPIVGETLSKNLGSTILTFWPLMPRGMVIPPEKSYMCPCMPIPHGIF